MKKEQLIKKIGDVVMKNSKKGILTTTKFVGTYNYKSGYDSYFAVSLNMDKVLIVYSYYQNDRGEHLDTPVYKLADLPENELQEIYDNLGTDDEDSLGYVGWTETEEKNLSILVELGIYKPKETKKKKIDINAIPELENPDDAYYIDRDENVHVLKCLGRTVFGNRIFDVEENCNGNRTQPYHTDKPTMFCSQKKAVRNKGVFIVVGGDDMSDDKYVYVPNKKALLKLVKEEEKLKEYYFINDYLETWSKTLDKKPEEKNGRVFFNDKDKAIAYFNDLRNKLLTQLNDVKQKLEEKKFKLSRLTNGVELIKYGDCHVYAREATPGVTYFIEDRDKCKYIGPFTVVRVEKDCAFLDNGQLAHDWTKLITPEDLEKFKASEKYKKVSDRIEDIDKAMMYVDRAIKFATTVKPFTRYEMCIPSWVINDAKELINKPVPSLKTVGA